MTNSARLAALGELCTNRALRRAELAWGGFHAAEWASLVALSVVAYEAAGTMRAKSTSPTSASRAMICRLSGD